MTFIEIFGLVVSGAGTFASVLGIFFAVYAKHNGRLTREFIAEQNKEMQKFIAELFTKLDGLQEVDYIETKKLVLLR